MHTEFKGHKVHQIKFFDSTIEVICTRNRYSEGNRLAVTVYELGEDELVMFANLTVNLHPKSIDECSRTTGKDIETMLSGDYAFVKDWSENSQWANGLCLLIGAKPTAIRAASGYVTSLMWDFSGADIKVDDLDIC